MSGPSTLNYLCLPGIGDPPNPSLQSQARLLCFGNFVLVNYKLHLTFSEEYQAHNLQMRMLQPFAVAKC
jgi:hypothetical protein